MLPVKLPAFLWHFIRKQRWSFIVLFSCMWAHALESNVLPYALKKMVDATTTLNPQMVGAFAALLNPMLLFIGAWTLMIVIWRVQEYVYAYAMPRLSADIRMALVDYTHGHSHAYFASHFSGTIAGKIGDMPRVAFSILEIIRWKIVATTCIVLVAVIWLGAVHIGFSLILGGWIIVHLIVSYAFAYRISAIGDRHAEDENILRGHIVDVLSNFATTRLFARRAYEQAYIGGFQHIEQASHQRVLYAIWKARIAIDIPIIVMFALMLWLLLKGWQAGWATSGDMVFVLFTSFNVMAQVWLLSSELPRFFSEIGVAHQALSLITQIHEVADVPDAKPLAITRGEIRFQDVRFHYLPGREIFQGMNVVIRPGEKIGLVGFSGSGKSTFVNLLLRLYDVQAGHITVDGQDVARVTQESLHAAIAMIPQDTSLFHRTLMENIRYGKPEATDAEVIAASQQAHCHEFVLASEHGYESLVGERGVKLSGGQRQRIAIARAMLKNAPILILDEATSSLDSITEHAIQESLATLMQGRTAIVIAHRLSTLAHLDRILVFRDGQIVEDGDHAALLAAGGHYATLWRMQAGGFLPDGPENQV